jgi:2-polyprenyl-6-methoxyphenol hydroxylase-like FAD-dependent oxidoreductase
MSGQRTQTEVLIVGGGLVGLTAALLLRAHDVTTTLVEKRSSTSPQPKARRLHMRSMEIFRQLGLARLVHDAARDLAGHDHMAVGDTLAEARQLPLWQAGGPGEPVVEPSPELPCLLSQDLLEPLLRKAALDAGVENVNVNFSADLAEVVAGREFNLCQITGPAAPGALASVDGRRRWVFMAPGADTDRDWPALLRRALGVTVPDLQIMSVLGWQSDMRVADAYRAGSVFLAGDAAHVMPPFAASGANTGIADAHNLAWKLATVLRGQADDALLDSYDTERRPAGWFAADESTRRTRQIQERAAPDPTLAHPYVLAVGGYQYTAGALIASAADPGDPEPTTRFNPQGRVGTRVPHRWLDPKHASSTIDLAGPHWAILTRHEPPLIPACAGEPRVVVHQARDIDFGNDEELILIRPDHVVAWRGTGLSEAHNALRTMLRPTGARLQAGRTRPTSLPFG